MKVANELFLGIWSRKRTTYGCPSSLSITVGDVVLLSIEYR